MKFDKTKIVNYKFRRRHFITYRNKLDISTLKDYFYNSDEVNYTLKHVFPGKDIRYCHSEMYHVVSGDLELVIQYTKEKETFYMFISANSFYAPPQQIAIGKAVGGNIYLIAENFPIGDYNVKFIVIPETSIDNNEKGFIPKSYNHSILIIPPNFELERITDTDIKCINIAYEGIKAFSDLVKNAEFEF